MYLLQQVSPSFIPQCMTNGIHKSSGCSWAILTLGSTIPVAIFLSLKKPEGMQISKTDIIIRIILGHSVQFSCSVVFDSLQPHESQHARPPCPSPTPGVHPNSRPLSQWCHPTISSSVVPFSSHLQSFPASGSFPMSQFFASDRQSIRVSASASVLPMNI